MSIFSFISDVPISHMTREININFYTNYDGKTYNYNFGVLHLLKKMNICTRIYNIC